MVTLNIITSNNSANSRPDQLVMVLLLDIALMQTDLLPQTDVAFKVLNSTDKSIYIYNII